MDMSVGKHLFQKRNERIDWRKLAAVDVEKIARDVDVEAIQENIVNVTFCNVEQELGGYHELDANVLKLFRLAQLTIEYLLHSQEFLQKCLSDKDRKIESLHEELNTSLSQCSDVNDELSKRQESYKGLKKELQKAKKLIGDYQLMVRSGANGLHKCTACAKSFVTEYYLRSHVERRHSDHKSADHMNNISSQSPNGSLLQGEVLNELDGIKTRLKATEDELKRERESVHQLNLKENDRSKELLEFLKIQKLQKHEEQEEIKAEMEGYKNMMMKELKETQRENENLKETLSNVRESTEQWRNSTLGNLEDDDDGGNKVYDDLSSQIKDLKKQLMETSKENEELKGAVEKWKAANKKLASDEKKYRELYTKAQKIEMHFQRQFDLLGNKYENAFVEAIKHCNEAVKIVNQRKELSSLYATDVVDAKKPLRSPRVIDSEADSISLWVSSNATINNCYRVSQKPASTKGDWIEVFSFRALLAPSELFGRPIHVFSCGGSPYWRQYISLTDEPPTPSYKKELTFYASATKLMGSMKLFILNIGSSSVVRSMLSKKEDLEGWHSKGEHFYAFIPKSSLNRSGTLNSSDVFRSVSDDEVSLSSLTGTDMARDNLAEALKLSRDNLDASVDADMDEDITDKEEENMQEESIEIPDDENKENEIFTGTSSTSFLGTTLLERGEFYPFPQNQLAVARYNHSPNMINAQREEIITIINDSLIKRGIDVEQMPSHMFTSKMKNHEKELKLIEKQNPGCTETRRRILSSIENYADSNFNQTEKGKTSGRWNSDGKVVKAAVRFRDDVKPREKDKDHIPSINIVSNITTNVDNSSDAVTPMSKEQLDDNADSDDDEDDESSEWNSEELDNQMMRPVKNTTLTGNGSRAASLTVLNSTPQRPPPPQDSERNVHKLTLDNGDLQLSDSDWDSDELSSPRRQKNNSALANTLEDSFDQYESYNTKVRPPSGDKVKALAASLESTLSSRDSTKKIAGGVDLHPV